MAEKIPASSKAIKKWRIIARKKTDITKTSSNKVALLMASRVMGLNILFFR